MSHDHEPANFGQAFAIDITLDLAFVILELIYGRLSNSLVLVADDGHNLGDVLGLAHNTTSRARRPRLSLRLSARI